MGFKSYRHRREDYQFAIHVWDNHANLHKDHQVKPALERKKTQAPSFTNLDNAVVA